MVEAALIHPLAERRFACPGISLAPAPFAERISLRADFEAASAIGNKLGFKLPSRPRSSAGNEAVTALWLGPDEWMLVAQSGTATGKKLDGLDGALFSAVDVSHRNTAIMVEGTKAADAINSGCPQDLSLDGFPVGACARTILAKSEIILWRESEHKFRVECWGSFADYVWNYLVDAAKSA